jgi:hypothetical protein
MTFIILCSACKPSQKINSPVITEEVKLKTEPVIALFEKMQSASFNYTWLQAKADVAFKTEGEEEVSFDVNIRAKKDSVIWISITPILGIEFARLLITKDSISILDKLHKKYIRRDYSYLEDFLKTPVDFYMVQALLCGNYFNCLKNDKLKSVYEEAPLYILSSLNKRQVKRALEEKDLSKPLIQDFYIDTNYRVVKTIVEDNRFSRNLEINYSTFKSIQNTLMPMQCKINVRDEKQMLININYSKVTTGEPQNFSFTIPEKYSRD